ncbi:hypothetical protein BLA29_002770 [Euroglyphus maynei]|uniref:Ketoreductase (KR) domain-containing protein n=1 Tax=Euroglyphus maynei TaxID=6958 RepID=A0A1Y3BQ51_EURMA|nr:hypothetical protein BLA29_002770 [Euroglyphus maynei]
MDEEERISLCERILLDLDNIFKRDPNIRDLLNKSSVNSHFEELDFARLLLIRKPKCASVFTYREWLLNSFLTLNNGRLNEDLISNELRVTLNAADRYSRNYYAWSHRTWLLTVYIVHNDPITNVINKIINDLRITAEWLEQHISDYSGFQHRQFLFSFVHKLNRTNLESSFNTTANLNSFTNDDDDDGDSLDKCCQIFFQEFQWLSTLWPLYPAQESLFLHRLAIITGAARGLGREYALLLASRGAAVIVIMSINKSIYSVNDLGGGRDGTGKSFAADSVVNEIKERGVSFRKISNRKKHHTNPDLDSVEEGDKIVQTAIDNFGRIDILINNAGILRDKSLMKMTAEDFGQ